MNIEDGMLVVFLAFLSGMGNNIAKEIIDYFKEKKKKIRF